MRVETTCHQNIYAYVRSIPLSFTDPNGLFVLAFAPAAVTPVAEACALNPACVLVVANLTRIAVTAGLGALLNEAADPPDSGDACPIPGTTPGRETKGRTDQREKDGDIGTANDDFDNLTPTGVRPLPDGGRVGTLPDGRTVVVRPSSSDGGPTVEIQDGKKRVKVRYGK